MLIGLASLRPQVGKTTIAHYLKRQHGFTHVEMSDPISILAEKFFGYNGDKSDPNQRKILQELGMMGKRIDPTIWIYNTIGLARRKMWGLESSSLISPTFLFYYNVQSTRKEIIEKGIDSFLEHKNLVIGGIRSPDEADEIVKIGGKVLCIVRDIMEEKEIDKHPVENQLYGYRSFYKIIYNNGTIEYLNNAVENILNTIAGK